MNVAVNSDVKSRTHTKLNREELLAKLGLADLSSENAAKISNEILGTLYKQSVEKDRHTQNPIGINDANWADYITFKVLPISTYATVQLHQAEVLFMQLGDAKVLNVQHKLKTASERLGENELKFLSSLDYSFVAKVGLAGVRYLAVQPEVKSIYAS